MRDPFEGWEGPLRSVVVQNRVDLGDPEGTLDRAMGLCHEAAKEHSPDLMVLPESFVSGFDYSDIPGSAKASDRSLPRMMDLARGTGSSIIFSLPIEDGGRTFNRTFWITGEGKIGGTYDKTHLFSRSGEDRHFTPGTRLRIFRINGAPVGVLTCYELRYPELARTLAVHGAGVIVFVGEWPASRVHQWEAMLRSRAIENQVYTVGANICGMHGKGRMGGRSAIIEPFGSTLCSLAEDEGSCFAELDRGRIDRFRKMIRQESDRRPVEPPGP